MKTLATFAVTLLASSVAFAGSTIVEDDDYNQYESNQIVSSADDRNFKSRSSFPNKRAATGNNVFIFSPASLTWAAYDSNGNLVRSGRGSGGKLWCGDVGRPCRTPAGSYKVYRKGSAACKSNTYPLNVGGAEMPHCMFFSGGYSIHGSADVPNYNASHGCIRVHPSDARWLSQNFVKIGTTVIVGSYRH